MKTINNNKTMNAPQVLSENEMQNVSGGVVISSIVAGGLWGAIIVGSSFGITYWLVKKTTGEDMIEIFKGK